MKLILTVLWTAVLPSAAGLVPCALLPRRDRTPGRIILCGFLLTFGMFELAALPVLLLTPLGDFALLVRIFRAVSLAAAVAGIALTAVRGGLAPRTGSRPPLKAQLLWLLFFGLLAFQLCMSYTHAFFDGDDAYYVTQSVLSYQTDTMYAYLPYTGITTTVDYRHALAMFPMWAAAVSRLASTHPTIVLHSFLPLVLIPLTDLVWVRCAAQLYAGEELRRRQAMVPAFMVGMALLQIFGNVSIYTPENFLVMRTWQGKSLLANLVLPAGFMVLLEISRAAGARGDAPAESTAAAPGMAAPLCTALLLSLASGLFTSMAPLLLLALMGAGGLVIALRERQPRVLWGLLAATLPCWGYMALMLRFIKLK